MENKEIPVDDEAQQDTIFTEEMLFTEKYDKHIRQARTAIFVVGGLQLLAGIIFALIGDEETKVATIAIACVVSAIFVGLGFWSKKKPYTAICLALTVYIGLLAVDGFFDPSTIMKGIIIKIIIIVYLFKGINDAKEAQANMKHGTQHL